MHTPDNITELKPNEYIVVGTNYDGNHGGGLAAYAQEYFGLQPRCAHGISGQCYCIVTMTNLGQIEIGVKGLIEFAIFNPDKIFYLTKIGTGIAGFSEDEIKGSLKKVSSKAPNNIIKPKGW